MSAARSRSLLSISESESQQIQKHERHVHLLLRRALVLGSGLLGLLLLLILGTVLFVLWYRKRRKTKKTSPYDLTAIRLQRFSFRELKAATGSFSSYNRLGKGGFGIVYKGVLRNGKEIAVKKMDADSLQGEREFQNELSIIGGLRSPFVVSLLGYCVEGKKRLLVYERMHNRSLQEALFENEVVGSGLDWDKRFKIILDTAQALVFLHLDCDPPIVHGDIKPSNVLLDAQFNAKLADFGLARVKTEADFSGPELFSQDLGRSYKSQDLSKSQEVFAAARSDLGEGGKFDFCNARLDLGECKSDLSGDVGLLKLGEKKMENLDGGGSDKEDSEVDFALALQMMQRQGHGGGFGKEIVENCGGQSEGWNDESRELKSVENCGGNSASPIAAAAAAANAASSPKQPWGKDWWWRQDGSGELCAKDYVMEWIGSQIKPYEENKATEKEEEQEQVVVVVPPRSPKIEEPSGELSVTESMRAWDKKCEKKERQKLKQKYRHRKKFREWWKEEYFAELNKKSKKLRKLENKWKRSKIAEAWIGECYYYVWGYNKRRKMHNPESDDHHTGTRGVDLWKEDQSPDIGFGRRGASWNNRDRKKKRQRSTGSDLWSGDLLSRDVSSTTSMRGTVCYIAPEYGGCGFVSEKGDIYSFGVLMLVIISGRRPLHILASPMKDFEKANLISWARHLAQAGNILDLVDEGLRGNFNRDQASLCITLALLCLQRIPELRPDISEIMKVLKGEMDAPGLPLEFSPSPPCRVFSRSRRRFNADCAISIDFP